MVKSIWKGSISFGLVNIPVEMHSVTVLRDPETKFTLLHKKDLSPIRYARICKEEGKEVPWSEIVKGHEDGNGHYVVLTEEEIKEVAIEKQDTIDILQFVEEDEIDTIYYEKPYSLEAIKGSDKAYNLLLQALKKSKKVGIAKFVLHGREHLGVLKFYEEILVINQLRFDEDLKLDEAKAPKGIKVPAKEMDIAVKLINQMTGDFKPKAYKDLYKKELKATLKSKKPSTATKAKVKSPKVHDIMSLLKESLNDEKKPKKKRVSA